MNSNYFNTDDYSLLIVVYYPSLFKSYCPTLLIFLTIIRMLNGFIQIRENIIKTF